MSSFPIYFDYMSTTPIDPRVIEKMLEYMGPQSNFGNPASTTHKYGKLAMQAVDKAREQIADVIGASPQEIIWTSGATESDNLALIGAAQFYQRKGRHIITVSTEHKAVLDTCAYLEKENFEVTYLQPESSGLIDLEKLEQAIRPDTILVSIMHVNNEIGTIQDIQAIGDLLKGRGIVFHVDAAQGAGKVPIDVDQMSVDLMSFSGHKIYGPKGIGALYVRRKPRVRLQPMIHGGGHENGMRSGTLATQQIAGMGMAFEIACSEMQEEHKRLVGLRDKLWQGIKSLKGVSLNGCMEQRVAGNLNVCFEGVEGDSLLLTLRDLAVSTTSACSSASVQPSYVLTAIGLSDTQAHSSLRLSLGRFTTEQEVEKAIALVNTQVTRLHEISPL